MDFQKKLKTKKKHQKLFKIHALKMFFSSLFKKVYLKSFPSLLKIVINEHSFIERYWKTPVAHEASTRQVW